MNVRQIWQKIINSIEMLMIPSNWDQWNLNYTLSNNAMRKKTSFLGFSALIIQLNRFTIDSLHIFAAFCSVFRGT